MGAPGSGPSSTTNQQQLFYDNQDTFSLDIDEMFDLFITSIDNVRSHYNSQATNANQPASIQYQESRCHAFLRMLGMPVVANDGTFYSPGYDPNLNQNSASLQSDMTIGQNAVSSANSGLLQSISVREGVPLQYNQVWAASGINATSVCIGSVFLRSFANQFNPSLGPLDYDANQIQNVQARSQEISSFFAAQLSTIKMSLLTSTHILKPFVVDPRVDNNMQPNANRMSAPFLLNRGQLKIFTGGANPVVLRRPYIEFVLSLILNASNQQQLVQQPYITSIIDNLGLTATTDTNLSNLKSSIQNLQGNQAAFVAFSKLDKIIRAIIRTLADAIKNLERIRGGGGVQGRINFQPIPRTTNGIEVGSQGGTISAPVSGDPNNTMIEANILSCQQALAFDQFYILSSQLNGIPDPGDFVFSGADDIVFDSVKKIQSSNQKQLDELNNKRTHYGNQGLDDLKTIEIIMGEFSGIGLLDIVGIQMAMWITSPNDLLGLIDANAYGRLKTRSDLSIGSYSPTGGSTNATQALTNFESSIRSIYKLIDGYIQTYIYQAGVYADIQP
jgi:hypothetical protein